MFESKIKKKIALLLLTIWIVIAGDFFIFHSNKNVFIRSSRVMKNNINLIYIIQIENINKD
jgi:hypothetical protein